MQPAPLQELRRLLANPSHASWRILCQDFLTEDLFPVVSQEVTQRLHAWSDELREVMNVWLLSPSLAKEAAPLVRSLSLDFLLWPEASLEALLTAFPRLKRIRIEHTPQKERQTLSKTKTTLTHLSVRNSGLASLEELSIASQGSLLALDLSHNQLTEVSLSELPASLQTLDLSNNKLSLWREQEASLPMLQTLSLANNLFQEPTSLEDFWRSRSFPMLRELDLSGLAHAAEPLYYHAKPSPLCQNIQSLSLNQSLVNDEQLESISRRSDHFSRLKELHVRENPISDEGLSNLGKSLVGKRLHSLSLSANEGVTGFELHLFSMLKSLSLQGDGGSPFISAESLRELNWAKLESLSLPGLLLGDEVFEVFEEIPFGLSSLDLTQNELSAAGLRRFLLRCHLSSLKRLSLAHNPLQSGVAFLAEYESTHHVERLDLSYTQLDNAGLVALCGWMTALLDEGFGLRSLTLSGNRFGIEWSDISALSQCRGLSSLNELRLSDCRLTERELELLCASPYLQQLKALDISQNALEPYLPIVLQSPSLLGLSSVCLSPSEGVSAMLKEAQGLRALSIDLASPMSASETESSSG